MFYFIFAYLLIGVVVFLFSKKRLKILLGFNAWAMGPWVMGGWPFLCPFLVFQRGVITMDFALFQAAVIEFFDGGWDFQEETEKVDSAPVKHYRATVHVRGNEIMVHLSNPRTDHWNAWPEPTVGLEKLVNGAKDGFRALEQLAKKLR